MVDCEQSLSSAPVVTQPNAGFIRAALCSPTVIFLRNIKLHLIFLFHAHFLWHSHFYTFFLVCADWVSPACDRWSQSLRFRLYIGVVARAHKHTSSTWINQKFRQIRLIISIQLGLAIWFCSGREPCASCSLAGIRAGRAALTYCRYD